MNRVPPVGPLNAKIIALGESPGREEFIKGEPFVGTAGQTLNDLLGAVGIERSEVYITNTWKGEIRGDKDDFFFKKTGKGKKLQVQPTDEYMQGIMELLGEIQQVREAGGGNVIVPMGNYALWACIQELGITSYRGSILEHTLYPGLKVIPTMHPAWYHHSQQWNKFILSEWDWQRIAEESKTPEIVLPTPTIIIDPDDAQIEDAIYRFTHCEELTVDTEWRAPEKLAYIGFSDHHDYAVVIPATSMQAYRAYKKILSSDVPKIMQNAAFDTVALHRIGIEVRCIKHDTMVAFNCCWSDIGQKGLDVQASVFTRMPYYKDEVEFVNTDDELGMIYCGKDCVVTHDSMDHMLNREFKDEIAGGARGYEISMLNMDIFIEASKTGMLADMEKLRSLKKEYLDRAHATERLIAEVVGRTINCRSWPQVQKLVYDDMGYGKSRKERSTKQEVLMDIAASEMDNQDYKQLLTLIIRVRQDLNMVSRYINEDVVDRDGRIRTNWNLAGTKNGRYSTTDPWWNGWAQQTAPYDAREIVIADPGHVFVGHDLEQAEARVVAVLTNDFDLIDLMNSGVDIHTKLIEDMGIFNLTYDQAKAQIKEVGKDKHPPRVLCKTCRHSMNYVQTWAGLKARVNKDYLDTGVGINAALAKLIAARYLELNPGLETWWEEVYHRVKHDTYLINDLGRRRNILGRMSKRDHTHRDVVAFQPQSDIADLTTITIREVADEAPYAQCFHHGHDGSLWQVPERREEEFKELLKKRATKELIVGKESLIIPANVTSGRDWKNMN
jgi:DNA polymerase-1